MSNSFKQEQEIQLVESLLDHKTQDQSVNLAFIDVSYTVNQGSSSEKSIISNVSGFVNSGEVLYIMGPSGSGKTTLLDYINNMTQENPKNNVFLNGQSYDLQQFRQVARYCPQQSELYEVFTVYQTLRYAASFYTQDKDEINKRVNSTIKILGLENQKNTKIGGKFFRGISGGQKSRVAIGEQLVANPKILFLDEPTSGLDSAAAFGLMENLRTISKKMKVTILCSIHQPSQRVFDLCDKVLLLAGGQQVGGKQVFFGKREELAQYLEDIGVKNETNQSTSEYMIDLVNEDFGKPEFIKDLIVKYKKSDIRESVYNELVKIKVDCDSQFKSHLKEIKPKNSQIIYQLTIRAILSNIINPLAFIVRLLIFCLMGAVLGAVWYDSAPHRNTKNMQDILFFMSTFFPIMTICIMPTIILDKQIMLKETYNGAYKLWHYSISHFIATLPFTLVLSILTAVVPYTMVGFNVLGIPLAGFIFTLFCTLLATESIMQIISYISSDMLVCIVIVAFIQGINLIFNGFMIAPHEMPAFLKFIHYIDYLSYSLQNFMFLVFSNIMIQADYEFFWFEVPGTLLLGKFDMENVNMGLNYVWLVLFALFYRGLGFLYGHYFLNNRK